MVLMSSFAVPFAGALGLVGSGGLCSGLSATEVRLDFDDLGTFAGALRLVGRGGRCSSASKVKPCFDGVGAFECVLCLV